MRFVQNKHFRYIPANTLHTCKHKMWWIRVPKVPFCFVFVLFFLINWNAKLERKFWFLFLYWSWDMKHKTKNELYFVFHFFFFFYEKRMRALKIQSKNLLNVKIVVNYLNFVFHFEVKPKSMDKILNFAFQFIKNTKWHLVHGLRCFRTIWIRFGAKITLVGIL